jgi:diguanylate cyclase (GGDEF)-like protein
MSKLVVYNIDCKLTYKNNRDRVVIGIIKSIDKQNEVSYYATQEGKDFFTGLLNKRACKEYVQDSIATNKDIHYMAMIDIDNFKNVNDTYGHLYGDKVILKVAAIINSALNGRGIVGRFGGDEFFIFTNWITKESQLRSILTFIKQKVRAELGQGENSCDVTLSMGVCKYPDNGSDYDSLFNKADKCLYIAKNKGKNRYIIYDAQKHGDFLDDMGRKGFSMAPIKKGETLAQEVADMSINLIKNGSSVLDNVLQRACKAFEIDGISATSCASVSPFLIGAIENPFLPISSRKSPCFCASYIIYLFFPLFLAI